MLSLLLIYPFWIGMMAVHELGHVIGATATGGTILDVRIPLIGFSQTDVHPNPSPRVEVWCGPVIGAIFPIGLWLALFRTRARTILHAFAGWCLIVNGVYLGVGWVYHVGDAGELVRLGTPVALLIAFGVVSTASGLCLWHLLERPHER
ncbi:MAG: hypothetical protein M3478_02205 [Planctomycetota bacterium]|nr:hypothetical protein [Planctomycetota bacterium]